MQTLDEDATLTLVRCKTCGRVLGNLYERFIKLRALEEAAESIEPVFTTPAERAFKTLGIMNECCRFNLTNPPRIPVGGYFFRPENTAPNTYVMGEYGKNYGDPKVLDELNSTVTEPEKRSLIKSGLAPVYKRVVSASSQRYGNRFQPSLRELYEETVLTYVNLNDHEMEAFRKGLWHLFLFSMYVRGWRGPEYAYPTHTTGLPDITAFIADVDDILQGRKALSSNVKNAAKLILTYAGINADVSIETLQQAKDVASRLIIREPEAIVSPNANKMREHFDEFVRHITTTQGVLRCYRLINSINVINGTPTKQSSSLHFRLASITGTNAPIDDSSVKITGEAFDLARIIAITCYYILDLVSGVKIANFNPKDMTIAAQGLSFMHSPSPFVPYFE